jgi:hypothetical protein
MAAATAPGGGLIIRATFDSSVTRSANAAAIEGAVKRAIAVYETLFSDRFTIYILFRYATTRPNDTPLATQTSQRATGFIICRIGIPTLTRSKPTRRHAMTPRPTPHCRALHYRLTLPYPVPMAERSEVRPIRLCLLMEEWPRAGLMMASLRSNRAHDGSSTGQLPRDGMTLNWLSSTR